MSFDGNGEPVFGRLATDRPHQFKLQGIYSFNFGTTVGANYYLASGTPVSREARFLPPSNYPVIYAGRLSDGRTPVFSQTDLYLQHELKLGGEKRIILSLNVLNLFDQKTATFKFQSQLASGQGIDVTETAVLQRRQHASVDRLAEPAARSALPAGRHRLRDRRGSGLPGAAQPCGSA